MGKINDGRRAVWQIKYWGHTIESPDDFERHFDYVHYNPVKHGDVRCPHQRPWSTFHRWVEAGADPRHWACWEDESKRLGFTDIEQTVGEP